MPIELDAVTSGYNLSVINKNFQTIEDKMNAEVLWRKNSSVAGEAKMERDLDMDGHKILNADIDGSQITNDRAVRVSDMSLNAIPQSDVERRGKIVTFDVNTGQPIAVSPASGSATDVLNQLALPTGAGLIGTSNGKTLQEDLNDKFRKVYDAVADFGADPTGATSSDAQLQAWINALIADGFGIGTIRGIFKIDNPLLFSNMHGFTIHADAYIYVTPSFPAGEYILGFKEGGNGKIYGRFEVSGQLRPDINCGIKVWSENLGGTSNIDFFGCIASDVKTGWKFGDDSFANALVSEITVFGGHTSNTPRVVQLVGTQVYINFIGVQGISTLPAAFTGTTPYNITIKGSQLKWIGGELQHNDNITGAMVFNEPIVDAVHGNSYGNIAVVHTHVEIACAMAVVANLGAIGSTISERTGMSFVGLHGYHSQNNGPMIAVDASAADYTGFIHTDDLSMYAGVVRTQPNISALNAHVYYDPKGFGFNFVKGYQAVVGGVLHFPRTMILKVNNANGQTLTTAVNTVLFNEPYLNGDTDRWNVNYATGSFTVPLGGLKDVSVESVLRINSGTSVQLDVYVDGAIKSLNTGTAQINKVNVQLGDLSAGQVVTVRANLASGSAQTNGGALEYVAIYARR